MPDLARCLRRDKVDLSGDGEQADVVWAKLAERSFAFREGVRANTARFLSIIHTARSKTPWWEVHEFERLWLAIECDYLGHAPTQNKIKNEAGP